MRRCHLNLRITHGNNMEDLLLHPTTAHQLKALMQTLPHAVLISGATGAGKQAIAQQFVHEVFGSKSQNSPYLLSIDPNPTSIGVEEVRKIKDFLNRKTTGSATIRRIVLISEAQTMTTEAQNALLKTLEEPPADTMVILTASDPTALKQTIRSRSQQLLVLPVSQEAAEDYFKTTGYTSKDIQTAYYMSDGRVGLLKALLEGAGDHELATAILEAKDLLKMPAYERLVQVDSLSKDRERLALIMQGLERVVSSGLRQAADKKSEPAVRKFYHVSKSIQEAQEAISKSGNAKLVLTDLFLQM